ncbi:class I SAM-dependent methyltransferase [Neorhizobium sp. P12A]|nr:class I SAM-dependent methyltransferase [Neorhizobium sp. P12A]KAA0694520.1 class I SAM-dependent methyltransferase [Neorhizobium sp. P12A]
MTATDRKAHWQNVYTTKAENEVSWYEDTPDLSLRLLSEAGLMPEMSVIDIGGGASHLVDTLEASGQAGIAVLDLSDAALDTTKARLADASRIEWIVSDVTTWTPDRQYDLWHDRAAFHFLTAKADQQAYVRVLTKALKDGGRAIIGAFAPDGPEKCSGLPVIRYDAESLQAVLGEQFKLLKSERYQHTTPWGSVQNFQFNTFEKLPERLPR